MGYSHHWQIAPAVLDELAWARLCADTRLLFQTSPHRLCFGAYEPTRPPAAGARLIRFNGCVRDGCEDFLLSPDSARSYCKTERQPYDQMVCAVLAAARDRGKAIVVTSDGCAADWKPALAWASRVLRRTLRCPLATAALAG